MPKGNADYAIAEVEAIEEGRIGGDRVSFIHGISFGRRAMPFRYEVKLVDDRLELTRSVISDGLADMGRPLAFTARQDRD